MIRCRRALPLIVRSIEGETSPEDALRLARHVEDCTSCRILLARERRLAGMLDAMGDVVAVDESFLAEVMASLPERVAPRSAADRTARGWRRGLKLAGTASVVTLGAGLAARLLPSLRLDLSAPLMPRFTPEETGGWIPLFGAAAQWIRMTAESLAWTGPTGAFGPRVVGVLALEAGLVGAVALLAISGALAIAVRPGSRTS